MRSGIGYLAIMLMISGAAAMRAADPDFTGNWRLNESRSEIRALPLPPAPALEIRHEGAALKCREFLKQAEPGRPCTFTTDGRETRETADGWTMSSKAKWEGSAILLNTLVHRADDRAAHQHTRMDRWKLSRDGATLTIRRQIVRLHGDMESTLVYERQPPP